MSYRTLVADPPWAPALGSTWRTRFTDKARPQKHYPTMALDEIAALRPPTAAKAHLWVWVLSQHVEWGRVVAEAWGFPELVTMLTWAKPGMGVGQFQCNTEHVQLWRRGGRVENAFGRTGGTWFNWPRGRHSEKPEAFYDLVQRVSPGPYLEMFARSRRLGWDAWGNEVDSDAIISGAA